MTTRSTTRKVPSRYRCAGCDEPTELGALHDPHCPIRYRGVRYLSDYDEQVERNSRSVGPIVALLALCGAFWGGVIVWILAGAPW